MHTNVTKSMCIIFDTFVNKNQADTFLAFSNRSTTPETIGFCYDKKRQKTLPVLIFTSYDSL